MRTAYEQRATSVRTTREQRANHARTTRELRARTHPRTTRRARLVFGFSLFCLKTQEKHIVNYSLLLQGGTRKNREKPQTRETETEPPFRMLFVHFLCQCQLIPSVSAVKVDFEITSITSSHGFLCVPKSDRSDLVFSPPPTPQQSPPLY